LKLINPSERWSNGYTANASIGQGSVETSPLQMAMVTATIANRGISYEPRLIHRVLNQDGSDVRNDEGELVAPHEPKIRADLHKLGITNEQIELIRRGMWKVVNEPGGTGKRAQVKGVEVAGKTGTAQFWRETDGKKIKDNHTWFICFAPYDAPKFAVTVFVQGAKSGGGVSAPIAQKILEESLALDRGYDPGLAWLDPAVGSFAHIEGVDYKKAEVPAELAAPDQETADHTEAPPVPTKKREKQVKSRPDIRPDADQGGRIVPRAQPVRPREEKRNFFQRFFGGRNRDNNPRPAAPPPRQGR
jgi:penicillin-binding protein 2